MNVTVIICTYNRCQSLAKALDSVAVSVLPDSVEWGVLVVDNNSKDGTREVIEEYCRRYPGRFRYVLEPKQGKSHALNTAIREASGDVLAFMDDDVTVEPTWLQFLTAPLEREELAGVGGRILPAQALSPPNWLSLQGPYSAGGILALFDLGDRPAELHQAPFGTNMVFRSSVFRSMGDFVPIWAHARVARCVMRTQSSVAAYWLPERPCGMSLQPSFTTPCRRSGSTKRISWHFGLTTVEPRSVRWKSGPMLWGFHDSTLRCSKWEHCWGASP